MTSYYTRGNRQGIGRTQGVRRGLINARRQQIRSARRAPTRQFVPRTMGPFAVSESKYFDTYVSGAAISESTTNWAATELDPATLNTLFCPTEGSDIDNRIGRRVELYKIALRGVISCGVLMDQTDVVAAPAVRLILYMDQQSNGTQSQGEDVMATPGAGQVPLVFSTFQNLANLGRFRVLRDKIYGPRIVTSGTDGVSTVSLVHQQIPFKMTVRFKKPILIKFNSTNGGTIGDIVDNSFHLIGTKSSTNYAHTISYQVRGYYKDK